MIEQIRNSPYQCQLQNQNRRETQLETQMLGLVMKYPHTHYPANAAADNGQQK